MKPRDKNYLLLQFRVRVFSKNGTEFQSFFEDIMEKAFSGFQKINPYGNRGDGGNDGYINNLGTFYQVYAPNTPKVKEPDAIRKLFEDFQKLKKEWDEIKQIKKYNFVFNDKYCGSVLDLEKAISQLGKSDPNIEFKLLLAKGLEKIFLKLDDSDILDLGFDIDLRKAISGAYRYLEKVEVELDRDNSKFALKILENSKEIIYELDDQELCVEYEILECRCYQKLERVDEAKEKFNYILNKYLGDPRPLLYLAEIYLLENNINENQYLLEKARQIDNKYWLLKLEELFRKDHLGEKINLENINEKDFIDDPKIKTNFYRLYAILFEESGDRSKSDYFMYEAIRLNPDKLSNHIAKLRIYENRVSIDQDTQNKVQKSQELLKEVDKTENMIIEFGEIGPRNKAILNLVKINAFCIQENYSESEKLFHETFKLILSCYFNKQIDHLLIVLLMRALLPDDYFNQLLNYLRETKIIISDGLSKELIVQFNSRNKLFIEGKKYFAENENRICLDFIRDLENKDYDKSLKFLLDDIQFASNFASTAKNIPALRRKIIEALPDDKNIQKRKLLLLLNFDEKNYDEAFKILKEIDLTNLSYFECIPILEIVQKKKAWDFEIIVLEKLLEKEKDNKTTIILKLQLIEALFNLKKYLEVIDIGEKLLNQNLNENILSEKNRGFLLVKTILACLERGKISNEFINKSLEILENYRMAHPTFEFKIGIEPDVYLRNNKPAKALESIIEGIKIKRVLTSEEYAKLYFIVVIQIGNQIGLKLDSLNKIEKNVFVKFKSKDQWYFIGNDNELDAIKINENNVKYSISLDKKVGDKIDFQNEYSSEKNEEIIEYIFSIEKYVIWQTVANFQKLVKDDALDGVIKVEVRQKEGTIDPKYLLKYFEDLRKQTDPFFEMYCKNNIPLAMLAISEGGLTNAIGRIQQEGKGFINFSSGEIEEFNKQKSIAGKVIDNKMPFYIDGTSALILSEAGVLKKIHNHIPNIKVPRSVISSLIEISEKFKCERGQLDHIGYACGKLFLSSIEKEQADMIRSNFIENIKIIESKPENISDISFANKTDSVFEHKIPVELSDACDLAKKEKLPILTEDLLYLKMNELETKIKPPEYFSSLALLRVLYEKGEINFEEYLDFYKYLSSYRFRFMFLNYEDIEKAVFGDGKIKIVNPKNIKKLNFSITLSKEYGVPFQKAFLIVGKFVLRLLTDNSVTPDATEKIIFEIIETFPTKMNKKKFGQMLLIFCKRAIENSNSKFVLFPKDHAVFKKIKELLHAMEFFNANII